MPDGRSDAQQAYRRRPLDQRLRAWRRYATVTAKDFGWLVITFAIVFVLLTASFHYLWNTVAENSTISIFRAAYDIIALMVLEANEEFPEQWYLEMYFFIVPVIGVIFVGLGVADFAVLLFNRQARQPQWEGSMASTFNHHTIICGLGNVGIRVVRQMVVLHEDVVVIEQIDSSERIDEVRGYDIPVITGDARSADVLVRAGLNRADAVIICTNNDLANLQIATRIREINPDVRIVMRMFEEAFGRKLAPSLNVDVVLSASALAAPAFVGAATRTEIMQSFKVGNLVMVLSRLEVAAGSQLDGCTVGTLEEELDAAVVLLQCADHVDVTPDRDVSFHAGDVLHIVAELYRVRELSSTWNRASRRQT